MIVAARWRIWRLGICTGQRYLVVVAGSLVLCRLMSWLMWRWSKSLTAWLRGCS